MLRDHYHSDFKSPEKILTCPHFEKLEGMALNRLMSLAESVVGKLEGKARRECVEDFNKSPVFAQMVDNNPTTAVSFIRRLLIPVLDKEQVSGFVSQSNEVKLVLSRLAAREDLAVRFTEFAAEMLALCNSKDWLKFAADILRNPDVGKVAGHMPVPPNMSWVAWAVIAGDSMKQAFQEANIDPRTLNGFLNVLALGSLKAAGEVGEPVRGMTFIVEDIFESPAVEAMLRRDAKTGWDWISNMCLDLVRFGFDKKFNSPLMPIESVVEKDIDNPNALSGFLSRLIHGANNETRESFLNSDAFVSVAKKSPQAYTAFCFLAAKGLKEEARASFSDILLASRSFRSLHHEAMAASIRNRIGGAAKQPALAK
jgi:hypothetical protein